LEEFNLSYYVLSVPARHMRYGWLMIPGAAAAEL